VASIHILSGNPNWCCSLKLATGRWTFKSTGLKAVERNRAAACSLCEQWQRVEDGLAPKAGSENHLRFENSREVAEQFMTATRKLAQGGFTEADARALLDELLKAGWHNPLSQESIRQFFDTWLEGKELACKKRTADRYRKVVNDFLGALGKRDGQPLSGLTPRDIEAFRSVRLKQGCSPVTVSQDLKIVRSILERARKQGAISSNPAASVESPRGAVLDRDVFTPEEVSALYDAADAEWKTAILFGYFAGMRLSDAVARNWREIDLAAEVVDYVQGKTGRRVVVPLHPELAGHLMALAGDDPKGMLTPRLGGFAGKSTGYVSKLFARVMASAGIDCGECRRPSGRIFSRKSFHALRHSFVSVMANAGIPDEVRQKLTGHASPAVHKRYTHIELHPLKTAIGALPALRK
jgi:integrase